MSGGTPTSSRNKNNIKSSTNDHIKALNLDSEIFAGEPAYITSNETTKLLTAIKDLKELGSKSTLKSLYMAVINITTNEINEVLIAAAQNKPKTRRQLQNKLSTEDNEKVKILQDNLDEFVTAVEEEEFRSTIKRSIASSNDEKSVKTISKKKIKRTLEKKMTLDIQQTLLPAGGAGDEDAPAALLPHPDDHFSLVAFEVSDDDV